MRQATRNSSTFIKTKDRNIKDEKMFKGQSLQQYANKPIMLRNYSSTSLYNLVYCTCSAEGAERGLDPGNPRQGDIQRVKLQKLKCCK